MRIILFILLISFCCAFLAYRWHQTIQSLNVIRKQTKNQPTSLTGMFLGLIWLSSAMALGLSAIYFYDRDVSPFFWLMIVVAVNGLGILALQEFFPDLRKNQS